MKFKYGEQPIRDDLIPGSTAPSVGLTCPMARGWVMLRNGKQEKKTHCKNMSEPNPMGKHELWIAGEVQSGSFANLPPCGCFSE